MKKLIKWLLGSVAFLGILMILAIILLPVVFDPNDHKTRIQQIASDAIGREVVLNGPIEWSVFPWIAINLNNVSVANETGFKGDYLTQVEDVAVRVKLLPLLQKQIKVGRIELKAPKINLQVAKSGRSNWQAIVDAMVAEDNSQNKGDTSNDLEIRGVLISDGQLIYTDGVADLKLELSGLSFNSEAIKSGQPTDMSLEAEVSVDAMKINGELNADWQALTLDVSPKLIFNHLAFKGKAESVPLDLGIKGEAVFDSSSDVLEIAQLNLKYGAMTLTTPVNGKNLSGEMSLSGQLNLPEFSLSDLFEQMGSALDNQADNKLSGSMTWSMQGDGLLLSELNLQLDDANINGQVDIRDLGRLLGSFKLNIDQFNLDQYLPKASNEEVNTGSSNGTFAMDLGKLSGQIKMSKLQAAGVKMEDITLNIKTQGKNISIEPLQAGFYQGLIRTELKLQPDKTDGKLQVTHSMQDFQAGGLLTDLMGADYLTGLGQLNADITVDEPFSERPLKTANGTISYRLSDGDIVGIDVYQIMHQSLSLLNKTDDVNVNEELKTAFGLMDIQANVADGVLKTETLRLTSPYFDLNGQVEVDLDKQTIRGTIKPMLTNIPEGILDERFSKLLNLRIPVKLRGELLAPDVSIDIEKLILETQRAKIDEKKEELKEDLFDAILGKKDKKKKQKQEGKQGSNDEQSDIGNQAVNGQTLNQPEMTEKERKRAEKDRLKRDLLEGLFKSSKNKNKNDDGDGDGSNGGN